MDIENGDIFFILGTKFVVDKALYLPHPIYNFDLQSINVLLLTLCTCYVLLQTATKIRREVKDLDNAISGRAVDALLNVEAVKLGAAEDL